MTFPKALGAVLVIILLTGVFHVATVRKGHEWGDDFSMYVAHAKNIAEGRPYWPTGLIYNPAVSWMPQSYPPVFPLLLSPIYKLCGLNLEAMKLVGIFFFLASLLVFYAMIVSELSRFYVFVVTALVALNPYFWAFKDHVLSDFPFLFFSYASLLAIDRVSGASRSVRDDFVRAAVVAAAIYLAYGTRSIGLVLIPCLVAHHMVRVRRLTRSLLITIALFALLMIIQIALFHGDASYLGLFSVSPTSLLANTWTYAAEVRKLWANGQSELLQNVAFGGIGLAALVGFLRRLTAKCSIIEIFTVLYAAPVVAFDMYQGLRYLIPLIPFYLFYAFYAVACLRGQAPEGVEIDRQRDRSLGWASFERLTLFLCITGVLASYGLRYATTDYGPLREGIGKPATSAVFDYIRQNTEADDIFVSIKPRALALFTGRRATIYYCGTNQQELWDFFDRIQVTYILVGRERPCTHTSLRSFVERHKDVLEPRYSNEDFVLYHVKRGGGADLQRLRR